MMNVECNPQTMSELESAFRFNDAVIRNMILQVSEAITEASPLAKSREERRDEREGHERRSESEAAEEDTSSAE